MKEPAETIRTVPILRRGNVRLTVPESRIVVRELINEHANRLAASLQLGFLIVDRKVQTTNASQISKGHHHAGGRHRGLAEIVSPTYGAHV
jgi:hypothetical protein